MKKILLSISFFTMLVAFEGCKKDDDYLNIPPIQVIPTEIAFSDPALVLSILGDLYNRQLDFSSLDNGWQSFADFSESFPSENGSSFIVQRSGWNFDSWSTWDYTYIRELNLFIQRDSAATALTVADKARFSAEARFLRASYYFELVKRMGGVPLITSPVEYDPAKGDISSIQFPRAKEADIYDFIISEAEAIKNQLPANQDDKSRASKAAALAMESRAALYAGSIAKYGVTTPQVSLPGGEVGIPSNRAAGYYTIALRAAQEIINGSAGNYKLYNSLPNLSDNFASVFLDKTGLNQESIYFEDFKAGSGRTHGFTTNDQPFSISDEGGDAGRLNPSLNLVEAFELLNGTYARLPTTDATGNPLFYTNQEDIFAGRDARLAGTVMLPNALFKGKRVDIWAGYQLADGSILSSGDATITRPLPGTTNPVQVVGIDGPVNGLELRSQSGFYIRKYIDPTIGSGRRGRGSDVPFVRYRFGEILLNAAEAAFELLQPNVALGYINQVRARAGLTVPLTVATLDFDKIVHERRVELAFEGHILFDLKRWRLAHIVWDGSQPSLNDLVSDIGKATKRSTQPWGLWPYKYYNPGNANNGKWLYKEVKPAVATGSNRFLFGNYYSAISNDVISQNPKIIRQPNQ